MSTIIQPIFHTHSFFDSTAHRAAMMFQPIQSTSEKKSDFLAYAVTPFIDSALEAAFAIDASIHLLNAVASFYNGMYLWTMNQSRTSSLVDSESDKQFDEGIEHLVKAASAIVAQTLNTILSIMALVTRPIASFIEAVASDEEAYDCQPSF